MLPIIKKVPVSKTIRIVSGTQRKYPFADMKVGDMFFVPDKTKNTLSPHVSTAGRALKMKFITRLSYMTKIKNGWLTATKTTKDAVTGIGVWRVK